jgi:hypothetical protein
MKQLNVLPTVTGAEFGRRVPEKCATIKKLSAGSYAFSMQTDHIYQFERPVIRD